MRTKQQQTEVLKIMNHFGVTVADVTSYRRVGHDFCWARLFLIELAKRSNPRWSNIQVARFVGRSNASTIIYAMRRFNKLMVSNPEFQKCAAKLINL